MKRKIFWNTFTATDSLLEGEEDPLFPTSTKTGGDENGKKLMVDGEWAGVAGIYFLQRTDVRH